MTKEELASKLNGREYTDETTREIEKEAKASGLVIIFGASDDLMEFRGAIDDEFGCYDGGEALIDSKGLLPERDQIDNDDELEAFFQRRKTAKKIKALWCKETDYSWTYATDIPHATFDIMEDGGEYCRGIVLSIAEVIQ